MRKLIIDLISGSGCWDYCFKRGDDKASNFSTYKEWLESLSDEDILAAYDRVKEVINNLD
jgi:hypothetical protein